MTLGQGFFVALGISTVAAALSSFLAPLSALAALAVIISIVILVLCHARRLRNRGKGLLAMALTVASVLATLPLLFVPLVLLGVTTAPENLTPSTEIPLIEEENTPKPQVIQPKIKPGQIKPGQTQPNKIKPGPINKAPKATEETNPAIFLAWISVVLLALALNAGGLLAARPGLPRAGKVATRIAAALLAALTLMILLNLWGIPLISYEPLFPATLLAFVVVGFYRLQMRSQEKEILAGNSAPEGPEENESAKVVPSPNSSEKEPPRTSPGPERGKSEPKAADSSPAAPKPPAAPATPGSSAAPKPPAAPATQESSAAPKPPAAPATPEPPTTPEPPAANTLAPGWYRDGEVIRYWDGQAWIREEKAP